MLLIFRRNGEEAEEPITFLGVSEDITKACNAVRADVLVQRDPYSDDEPEDDATLVIDPVTLQGEGFYDDENEECSWHVEEVIVL